MRPAKRATEAFKAELISVNERFKWITLHSDPTRPSPSCVEEETIVDMMVLQRVRPSKAKLVTLDAAIRLRGQEMIAYPKRDPGHLFYSLWTMPWAMGPASTTPLPFLSLIPRSLRYTEPYIRTIVLTDAQEELLAATMYPLDVERQLENARHALGETVRENEQWEEEWERKREVKAENV